MSSVESQAGEKNPKPKIKMSNNSVIPDLIGDPLIVKLNYQWIPAFAGMTYTKTGGTSFRLLLKKYF